MPQPVVELAGDALALLRQVVLLAQLRQLHAVLCMAAVDLVNQPADQAHGGDAEPEVVPLVGRKRRARPAIAYGSQPQRQQQ
jgi:hypothetical protein